MTILFWSICGVIMLFGFVVIFGAPYLPTLKARTVEALDMLNLQPGQTMLELGSGDGRLLREAANRGIYAIGYELNPLLVIWTKLITFRYRRLVRVYWRNYWTVTLPEADGLYVFLLDKYMKKLDKKITQDKRHWSSKSTLKVVSFAFKIPSKKVVREQNGLMLYMY